MPAAGTVVDGAPGGGPVGELAAGELELDLLLLPLPQPPAASPTVSSNATIGAARLMERSSSPACPVSSRLLDLRVDLVDHLVDPGHVLVLDERRQAVDPLILLGVR
jgi:hypothetical protein